MPHPSPSPSWYDHPNDVFSTNHEAPLQPPVSSSLFHPHTLSQESVLEHCQPMIFPCYERPSFTLIQASSGTWTSTSSYTVLSCKNCQYNKQTQIEQHWSDRPVLECNRHLIQWGHSLHGALNCASMKVNTITASANTLRTTSSMW